MPNYVDDTCLEKLTRIKTDDISPIESLQCFAILDPLLVDKAKEQASFSVLMDNIRSLQKELTALEATAVQRQRAVLKNNLGHALVLLGGQQSDETILKEGIRLLRETLGLIDEQKAPTLFALAQHNLASALMTLAVATEKADYVNEAVERYGLALGIFDASGQKELAASTRRQLEPFLARRTPSAPARDPAEAGADETDHADVSSAEGRSTREAEPIDPGLEVVLYGSLSATTVIGRDDMLNDGGSGYDYSFSVDPELEISAFYDTGLGIDYGADVSLDVQQPRASTAVMHVSGGFGELRAGQDSGAEDDMYIGGGDYQAGSGGIDGDAANLVDVSLTGSDDALKVSYYTSRRRGIQLGLSFTPDTVDVTDEAFAEEDVDQEGRFEDHVGLGANWVANSGGADILAAAVGSFGYAMEGDDLSSYSVGGGVSLGSVQFGSGYTVETSFNDRELLNFGVFRTFDPWLEGFGESRLGAGVAFLFPENSSNSTVLALSADMELATGLKLLGDIAYNHLGESSSGNDPRNVSGVLGIEMNY